MLRQRKYSHLGLSDINIKSGTDDKDTYRKMLNQIPRLTDAGATGVIKLFPTLDSLFRGYEACADQAERNAMVYSATVSGKDCWHLKSCAEFLSLSQVSHTGDGKKSDRVLNNVLATRVAEVFWGREPEKIVY